MYSFVPFRITSILLWNYKSLYYIGGNFYDIGTRAIVKGIRRLVVNRMQGLLQRKQNRTWIEDTEKPSSYIVWNNSPIEKSYTAELEIEPGTS